MAITNSSSYEDLLYEMQQLKGIPRTAELVISEDHVYDLDLNTRQVLTPDKDFLVSVKKDFNAEVIFFKCPRFYDNMDLANTVCVIEYLNAEHKDENGKYVRDSGFFWSPYYDTSRVEIETDPETGIAMKTPMLYIPWAVQGLATRYEGTIDFTVRFYSLQQVGSDQYKYNFNMSMIPSKGKIEYSLDLIDNITNDFLEDIDKANPPTALEAVYYNILTAADAAVTYWKDL